MRNFLLCLLCMFMPLSISGQITGVNAPKPLPNNYLKSKVVVGMKDGRLVQGTLSTVIHPNLNYIGIKESESKKKLKLMAEDIETITILPFKMKKSTVYSDTTVFARINIERELSKGGTETVERWLRVDYEGRNVSLYSFFYGEVPYSDMPGGASAGHRAFFLKKPGETVAKSIITEGAGTVIAFGRIKLYAGKFEDYPEIAERISNKEFDLKQGPYYVVAALDEYLDK